MYLEDAFKIALRNGFSCMQIQTNMGDKGFTVGSYVRNLDEAETRFMVVVPDTQANAMIVGKGSLKVMLEKLARRIKLGTICNIPLIPVTDKRQAWRILELDKLYLFLNDGVTKKDYPILSERQGEYNGTDENESSKAEGSEEFMEADIEQSENA